MKLAIRLQLFVLVLLSACGGSGRATFDADERASMEAEGHRVIDLRLAKVP